MTVLLTLITSLCIALVSDSSHSTVCKASKEDNDYIQPIVRSIERIPKTSHKNKKKHRLVHHFIRCSPISISAIYDGELNLIRQEV
mmetsp:Transcript_44544/g.118863  ORF Transcript_44544/g.118863 Transcript_44544/m.118863 type:complete len:86 (-) Transcript_44544:136-393(-)